MQATRPQSPILLKPFASEVMEELRFQFAVAHALAEVLGASERLTTTELLRDAYDRLFNSALDMLGFVAKHTHSPTQAALRDFLYARLFMIGGDPTQSLWRLESVAAAVRHDPMTLAIVWRTMAEAHHRNGSLFRARDAYQQSLAILLRLDDELRERTGDMNAYADPRMELDVLIRICGLDHEVAQYETLDQHMKLAKRLIEVVFHDAKQLTARLKWVEAIRNRSKGNVDAARNGALEVIDTLAAAPILSLGRAYIVAIDVTVDKVIAGALPATDRRQLFDDIEDYRRSATMFFQDHEDANGKNLLALTMCRVDQSLRRLGGQRESIDNIERALQEAKRLNDWAAVGRAYTVFGGEMELAGDQDYARQAYNMAKDTLTTSEFMSLSVYPANALMRLQQTKSGAFVGW